MNIDLCDACAREYEWIESESFHVDRYASVRVCGKCRKTVELAVHRAVAGLRAKYLPTHLDMPTQPRIYEAWLKALPSVGRVFGWRKSA